MAPAWGAPTCRHGRPGSPETRRRGVISSPRGRGASRAMRLLKGFAKERAFSFGSDEVHSLNTGPANPRPAGHMRPAVPVRAARRDNLVKKITSCHQIDARYHRLLCVSRIYIDSIPT